MRAMILAAGRGTRMGELTNAVPKPLLKVGGHYLIEYALFHLAVAGIGQVVINVSYLGEQIKTTIGDGQHYGIRILYSEEEERLETGGGILKALPLLGNDPFLVVSADVITDFPLTNLPKTPLGLAHLVMVENPQYHPKGDFGMVDGFANLDAEPTFTFANIGVYRKELFSHVEPAAFPLNRLLFPAISQRRVTCETYKGMWFNIGTAEDLCELDSRTREAV